jgi:predicted helicase
MATNPIQAYITQIRTKFATGIAGEHAYRPALAALVESLNIDLNAINDPKRIACGAPDFTIALKTSDLTVGYIETKDIGTNLDEMERGKGPHGEQFTRYRDGLPNWILTDYLEFRWFVNGEKRLTARIAELAGKSKINLLPDGEQKLTQLLDAFFRQPALTVGTAQELSKRMAGMTRIIRDLIVGTFEHEQEQGWLHNWLAAFRETLIPDLDEKQFADMFAQTLAYGLFAARVHAPPTKEFSREMAAFNLPKTNPFLRKLFSEIAGVDMPETIAWAVDDIVELLKRADMAAILKDFGKAQGKEDPVVHFYETFLAAYDPKMRKVRGVYYTPEPVVSYIVRSIDHLLKTRFNRPKGLADENTLILDPATGTATFLYFVIDQIYQKFAKQKGAWDSYVDRHLLNRIFGFELLMAPYTVAHLKLGMQLHDLGYSFRSNQRLGIYLTNTLEEAAKKSEKLFAQWISDEANAAATIKTELPIMVVLGNPPYSGISANRGPWITELIEDYRKMDGKPLGEKKVWLKNDYIKFIRFGQWRIERTGYGILGFITDHSYLDSPTFRGMRHHLLKTFNELYILNLHGNAKRREQTPWGEKDENVFDITQGVVIALFVKHPKAAPTREVFYADLWGGRRSKYDTLLNEDVSRTDWKSLHPVAPFFEFVPVKSGARIKYQYQAGWSVKEIFPVGSNGIQTSRDSLVVSMRRDELIERFDWIRDERTATHEISNRYDVVDRDFWKLAEARAALHKDQKWKERIQAYLYRPFDLQWLFASPDFVHRLRLDVMCHLLKANFALCVGRAGLVTHGLWDLAFCTNTICDHNLFYRGSSLNFPLYLYESEKKKRRDYSKALTLTLFGAAGSYHTRHPNLSPAFLKSLAEKLKLPQTEPHGLPKGITPEDIFHYAYAVFHSPTYRTRYAEFLKIDFPRLPLTGDLKLFRALAAQGAELAALHLMESPKLNDFITEFPEKGSNMVEKIRYTDEDKRVWINSTQYFGGVPRAVWEFHIGGYQVCEKWLKDRKGRKLSYEDIQHYQKIVVALNETIYIMQKIDQTIPSWPFP